MAGDIEEVAGFALEISLDATRDIRAEAASVRFRRPDPQPSKRAQKQCPVAASQIPEFVIEWNKSASDGAEPVVAAAGFHDL
jgi:hypothetical protein